MLKWPRVLSDWYTIGVSVAFGPYNTLVYASLRSLPVAIVLRLLMRSGIFGGLTNLPRTLIGGALGMFACWHVGIAAADEGAWNPMWGLIPVAVAEWAGYLSQVLELKQRCLKRRGPQFILPGGKEVWVPKTAPLTGIAAGFLAGVVLAQVGQAARIEFLATLFKQNAIVIGLNIVGVIALLDIPFMASRIAAVPSKA